MAAAQSGRARVATILIVSRTRRPASPGHRPNATPRRCQPSLTTNRNVIVDNRKLQFPSYSPGYICHRHVDQIDGCPTSNDQTRPEAKTQLSNVNIPPCFIRYLLSTSFIEKPLIDEVSANSEDTIKSLNECADEDFFTTIESK